MDDLGSTYGAGRLDSKLAIVTGAAVLYLAADDARRVAGVIRPVDAGATAATPSVSG